MVVLSEVNSSVLQLIGESNPENNKLHVNPLTSDYIGVNVEQIRR